MKETPVILNDDLHFLVICCQVALTTKDYQYIQNYLHHRTDIELKILIKKANQHAIIPLIYKTLSNINDVPPLLLSRLKKHYIYTVQKNILMTTEIIRIMKLLEDNSIEALAFKGPVLSHMAYGDITLRQYSDLDILIDEIDTYTAGKLMSKNGHIPLLPLSILSNKVCLKTAKDFSLMSKGGVHTELHWRLFEKKYNISLLSCIHEQKCQSVSINGNTIKTLQNELLLVYLCLHGAKHTFERIEWICDIDRLIRTHDIDWDITLLLAKQSHSNRAFFLGLALAKELMHTPFADKVADQLHTREIKELKNLVRQHISNTHKEKSAFTHNRDTFLFQSKLFDKKSDMLQFYLSTFFHISTNDCQTFRLPKQLKFLYIILRPLRLLFSYTSRLFN